MSDKKQALQWLLEGKKVTNPYWGKSYVFLNEHNDFSIGYTCSSATGKVDFNLFPDTGWKLYEANE